MPMSKKEDFAGGDINSQFCLFCADANGKVKTAEEIFEGGVQFFMSHTGGDRKMAEKATRKNMNRQSYWQGKDYPILKGEEATDEEFAEIMKKLH